MSNSTKFRIHHADLVRNVKATCLRYGVPEPDEFLAEVMAGRDPRYDTSPLYDAVRLVYSENRAPTLEEWEFIAEQVMNNPAYIPARVDAGTSIEAAKKLIDHMYPKLKSLEVSSDVVVTGPAAPLSDADIARFKAALADDTDF